MLGGGISLLGIRKKLKELTLFYRDPNAVCLVQRQTSSVLQRSHDGHWKSILLALFCCHLFALRGLEVYNHLLFWPVTACALARLGSQEEQQNKDWFTAANLDPSRAEIPPRFHASMEVLGDADSSGPSFAILLVRWEHAVKVAGNCIWAITLAGRWSAVMGTCWKLGAGYKLKPLNQTRLESHMPPTQAVRRNRLFAQSPVQLPRMATETELDGAAGKYLLFLILLLSLGSPHKASGSKRRGICE